MGRVSLETCVQQLNRPLDMPGTEFEFSETRKENFLYRFAKEKSLAPPAEKKHEPAPVGA